MPQIIKPTDFKLTNPKTNAAKAAELISNITTVIEQTDDYILFVSGAESGHIGLYNREDRMLDYMVKYRNNPKRLAGNSVTQVALWRKWDSPWVQGITRKIFFEHLLVEWPTIVSDAQQTEDGQRFWISRMAEASRMGYRVGINRMTPQTVDWFEGEPNDFPKWLKQQAGWDRNLSHSFNRFMISI